MLVTLAHGVLVRHQVHAVAHRRHQQGVGDSVQRTERFKRHCLVEVVYRRTRFERPILAVDATDQLVRLPLELLVLFDLAATWHCDLQQHDLPDPLCVVIEETFHGFELERDAFDVIETVYAQNDLVFLEPDGYIPTT
jgi:hypothetical protein